MSSSYYFIKNYLINKKDNMKKGKCNMCKKSFTHKKGDTLIGKLGPVPVDLCKVCFPKLMKHDELLLHDTRKV